MISVRYAEWVSPPKGLCVKASANPTIGLGPSGRNATGRWARARVRLCTGGTATDKSLSFAKRSLRSSSVLSGMPAMHLAPVRLSTKGDNTVG
jgi:hypothetical protein